MPDITIPEDLLAATLAARAATRAAAEYGRDLDAQARAAFPAPEQWLERASWPGPVPDVPLAEHDAPLRPAEQTNELHRLRAAASDAWGIVHSHPAYAAAREAGQHADLRLAVAKAAAEAEHAPA